MPTRHDPIFFPSVDESPPYGLETCVIVNYLGHTISSGDVIGDTYKEEWRVTGTIIPTSTLPGGTEDPLFLEHPIGPCVSSRIEPLATGRIAIRGMVSKIRVNGIVAIGDYLRPTGIFGNVALGYATAVGTSYDVQSFAIACESKASTGVGAVRGFVVTWRA